MPKPVINPCGGEGQPPCPPQPATPVNVGDVLSINEASYVVALDDDQGQNEEQGETAA